MSFLKNQNQPKAVAGPLFMVLLGTLAFNLSTLPSGRHGIQSGSRSLASHNEVAATDDEVADCSDLSKQLKRNGSGDCTIHSDIDDSLSSYTKIHAELVEETNKEYNDDFTKQESTTSKFFKITSSSSADTEAGTKLSAKSSHNIDVTEIDNLSEKVQDLVDKDNQKIATKAQRALDIQNCVKTPSGADVKEKNLNACYMKNIDKLKTSDAEAYYNENLKSRLEKLMSSSNSDDQAKGLSMLNTLDKNFSADSSVIKTSLTGISDYWALQTKLAQANAIQSNQNLTADQKRLQLAALNLPSNTAIDQAYKTQIAGITTDAYGNYAPSLSADLTSYNNRIDQIYSGVFSAQAATSTQNNSELDPRIAVRSGAVWNGSTIPAPGAAVAFPGQQTNGRSGAAAAGGTVNIK